MIHLMQKGFEADGGFFDAFLNILMFALRLRWRYIFPFYYYAGIPFGLLALGGGGGVAVEFHKYSMQLTQT